MNNMKVLHVLPDRIRMRVPAVSDAHTARRVEQRAQDMEGIHWVRTNVRCAGLVVRFDAARYSQADIVELVQQFTMEGRA